MVILNDALLTLSFLTRIPLPAPAVSSAQANLSRTFPYFPGVGILLGAVCAGGAVLLTRLFPPEISSFIIVAFLAWITRGLHLDGLADWADALGGGYTREKRLEILKDSRVGSFGVMALFFVIIGKTTALSFLIDRGCLFPILCAPLFSRSSMVAVAIGMQPAQRNTQQGLGDLFLSGFTKKHFILSLLWWIPFLIYRPRFIVFTAFLVFLEVIILRRNFAKNFGGLTGDLFGATCELVELTVLIAATLRGMS
ncbi:adenosylcobinamide-GDP ribazoletransferase [Thermodesulforhabdus norvegica]|uniref:Adenosylcobinamide-GDP ribazoletransferase n=1 Tax=Thermodesulforhabdus norvegica TaxID=39841 RepID=A0A1I4RBJ9_9BACT|nr:adenosylcobinamide-GDP ribazoletransferase [Thermodesulforhabdus norvegica]SFM49340.1 cobalamin-5'-phosphate synthase [Thermodesulforhabdus norvegica]